MSTQKLFRETAFNGYNRDDVREYIKKQDERIRELETAAADSEAIRQSEQADAQAEIEKLNNIIASLNEVIDEKNKENLELTEQVMQLKNALLEQTTALQEKVTAIDSLRNELAEITELYNNLKNDSSKQSEQLAAQSEKLSALDNKNKRVEDDLKTYIERSEKLKQEAESDLLAGSKFRELEATIAQKDERIKFLESNWNMHKNDYNVYTEVKNNVSVILAATSIALPAPSATMTIKWVLPLRRARRIGSITSCSKSILCSGIRMLMAPQATPT